MSDNWYESDGWYEPLRREPEETPAAPENKKKKKWPWILGVALLSLGLIIGLSLLFREPGSPAPDLEAPQFRLPQNEDGKKEGADSRTDESTSDDSPSYREYFRSLYPPDETESVTIRIPRVSFEGSFILTAEATEGETMSLQQMYEQCSPSVVGISGYVFGKIGYNWGSGVILSEDGLIITNTHVIDGCNRATVKLYDDSEYEAVLLGADSISDIAVLKIEADGLPAARFGDSSMLTVGQEVAAIGNPLGEEFRMTLTDGIISAISRDISYRGRTMTLMQTNAALNEGNSGGPLFNMYGQVIGITNMKMMSAESSIEGIGFAIPTSTVVAVVNAILVSGKVEGRTSIGITVGPIPDDAKTDYQLPDGLYIVAVAAGSDAEAKGLREGDILMAVNGQTVTETKQVTEIKDQFKVGDELSFTIWRDGKTFDIQVALMDTNDVYG